MHDSLLREKRRLGALLHVPHATKLRVLDSRRRQSVTREAQDGVQVYGSLWFTTPLLRVDDEFVTPCYAST